MYTAPVSFLSGAVCGHRPLCRYLLFWGVRFEVGELLHRVRLRRRRSGVLCKPLVAVVVGELGCLSFFYNAWTVAGHRNQLVGFASEERGPGFNLEGNL
jgi:hypothetical protein